MTGGTSGGMEARSHKWDDKKIEGLKKKKEDLESESEKLGSIREMQLKESEASGKISGLEKKIQYAEIEKKSTEDKLTKMKVEKSNIEDEIGRVKPEFQKLENAINTRTSKITSLEKRINDIVDRIFKRFSESVGVKNIREYEENHLKAVDQMAAEKLSLHNQHSKLKYQKKSAKFVAMRENQRCNHTMSRRGYVRLAHIMVVSGGGTDIGNDIGCDYDINGPKKSGNVDNVDQHQVAMQSNLKNMSCGYIPENIKCKLLHWCGDGVVAEGRIASTDPKIKVHHVPLGGSCWKVWVDRVLVEHVDLIRSNSEMTFLDEAIGSTIA